MANRHPHPHDRDGARFDRSTDRPVRDTLKQAANRRQENAAAVSMRDARPGKAPGETDEAGLRDDTLLMVNADRGFPPGGRDCPGKRGAPRAGGGALFF